MLKRFIDTIHKLPADQSYEEAVLTYVRNELKAADVQFVDRQQVKPSFEKTTPLSEIILPVDLEFFKFQYAWKIIGDAQCLRLTEQLKSELRVLGHFLALYLNNQALQKQVIYDGLTQIYNRAYFDVRLEQELSRSNRYHTPFSLLILDIDRFKKFNDTYGHQVGDEVLKAVAKALIDSTRESDLVFRYGGEEFAVLLPNTGVQGAAQYAERLKLHVDGTIKTAERLRHNIKMQRLKHDGKELAVSVSIGISTYMGGDKHLNMAGIIKQADEALYRAKQTGKDRSEVVGRSEQLKILVVDDQEEYCDILHNYFKERGYAVQTTHSGQGAMAWIKKDKFDFMFLDMLLPDMNGIEVLRQLHNQKQSTKIVVLTAVHDEQTKRRSSDLGACEYLEKPISLSYLSENLMARILEMKAE